MSERTKPILTRSGVLVLLVLLVSVFSFWTPNAGGTIPVDELITRDRPIIQSKDGWEVSWYLLQEMPYIFNISVENLEGEVRRIGFETIFSDLDLDKLNVNGLFEWKNITHTVEVADYETFYNETTEQDEIMKISSHYEDRYWFDWKPCKYQYFTRTAQEYRENMGEIPIGKYERKQFQLRFSPPMAYNVMGRIALKLGDTLFDPWYNTSWAYRKNHTINSAIGAGTNYQVNITVHYSSGADSGPNVYLNSKCQTDFGDIRFTDNDGETLLDYWIEEKHDGDNCTVWVEVADDLSSNVDIYFYYGNTGVSSVSNGANTFLLFDHFDDASINVSLWTTSGTPTESGTNVVIDANNEYIRSVSTWTTAALGARVKLADEAEDNEFSIFGFLTLVDGGSEPSEQVASYDGDMKFTSATTTTNEVTSVYSAAYFGSYHTYEVLWKSATRAILYIDGVLKDTDVTEVDDTTESVQFYNYATTADLTVDWMFVRKYVYPEPTHGTWGVEEEYNFDPSNDASSIGNMDDGDNLISQLRAYNLILNVSDEDGVSELDTILYSLSPNNSSYINGTINCQTNAHSFTAGSANVTAGSVTNVTSGNTANYTLPLTTQWDIPALSNWDIWLWVNDTKGDNSSWGRMQNDYFDTVNDLVISGFACDEERGNLGATLTFSGTVYYENDPGSGTATTFYPPDAEFTSVDIHNPTHDELGTDSSIVNGAFSATVTAETHVGIETYHGYIDMADADYTDADENPTDTYIADQQQIQSIYANNTTPNINEVIEMVITAQSPYDAHVLGAGDTLVLEDTALDIYTFTYNGTHWVNETSWASNNVITIIACDSVNEATYGITSLDMNTMGLSITIGTGLGQYSIYLSSLYSEVEEGFYNLLTASCVDSDGNTHEANITFTVDGASFEWNDYTEQYEAQVRETTPKTVTYDSIDSFNAVENPYATYYLNQTATVTWTTSLLDTVMSFMQVGDWMGGIIVINTELVGALFLYTFIMVALSMAIYNYTGAEATLLAWMLGWGMWSVVVHGSAVTIGLIFLGLGGGLLIVKMFLDSRRTT